MKKAGIGLFFMLIASIAVAQKLPNVQLNGVHIPANLKVEGKTTEWNSQFQAYNKSTEIFYTIDDDDRLYLIVHCKQPDVITKIIRGGVTFTVNPSTHKHDANGIDITYPLLNKNDAFFVGKEDQTFPDTIKANMHHDTIMHILNKRFTGLSKMIGITGIKAIADSVISVYNEYEIKVAARFDNKINFTYELSVPIKYLNFTKSGISKFSYHIALNGIGSKNAPVALSSNGRYLITYNDNGTVSGMPNTPQNSI
jgi:hypothetical protein